MAEEFSTVGMNDVINSNIKVAEAILTLVNSAIKTEEAYTRREDFLLRTGRRITGVLILTMALLTCITVWQIREAVKAGTQRDMILMEIINKRAEDLGNRIQTLRQTQNVNIAPPRTQEDNAREILKSQGLIKDMMHVPKSKPTLHYTVHHK